MAAVQSEARVVLRLLGVPEVRVQRQLVPFQPKRLALVAYLAVPHPGPYHRRDTLLGLFWPDHDALRARASLRQALTGLRRALGGDAVMTEGDEQVGLSATEVACDVGRFESALRGGDYRSAAGDYGGPLLQGVFLRDCPEFEQWIQGERDRLAAGFGQALEKLAQAGEDAQRLREAAGWWRRLADHDPYNGRVVLRLMSVLEAAGDRAGALRAAERHSDLLRTDLDADPDPAVVRMVERLKRKPSPPVAAVTPPPSPKAGREPAGDALARLQEALEGRYQVERELSEGGWSKVYLAWDLAAARRVAIKVLRAELSAAVGSQRFTQEIQILGRLQHPNILPLLHCGEAQGLPYYVTPFVEGESLARHLDREVQLPVEQAVSLTLEAASALAYAHSLGIIHRDVKPDNILLSQGHAVVADFGIARILDELGGARLTQTGIALGTPEYMSPEQAGGQPADGRSDIYSLACVLYAMLAGDPPFTGRTPGAVLAQHRSSPVPRVRTVRPTVPDALEDALLRALAKAPADRFRSMEAFADALKAAEQPVTLPVKLDRLWRRARRALRGRGLQIALAAGAAAAAITVAVVGGGDGSHSGTPADTSRYVIFPFVQQAGTEPALGLVQQLHDALTRWSGISVADAFQVREMLGETSPAGLTHREAARLALRLGAGRYLRGEVSSLGESLRLRVGVYDATSNGVLLADDAVRVSPDLGAADSLFAAMADRLLFRGALPPGGPGLTATRSRPARQMYAQGQLALERWDLAAADTAFEAATRLDPGYAQAHLWLALTRAWKGEEATRWRIPAEQAALGAERLAARDRVMAQAIVAQARGNADRACPIWQQLTGRESRDFAAWYGWAHCLATDDIVLPDASSPSGWRFRSSYHTALAAYQQAFELLPSILASFRRGSYVELRRLLNTAGNVRRRGHLASDDTVRFLADALWEGDSLGYVPYPVAQAARQAMPSRAATNEAVRRQRIMFRNIASMWVSASPEKAGPWEALAVALAMLGERSALDTLYHARRLARDDVERLRIAGAEVWMQVAFSVPSDPHGVARARLLADSILGAYSRRKADEPLVLAGLAALLGRARLAAAYARAPAVAIQFGGPPGLLADALPLLVYASLGGPADTLAALEARVAAAVDQIVAPTERSRARVSWLARPATLAFPSYRLKMLQSAPATGSGYYLLDLQASWSRGDPAAVRRGLERRRVARNQVDPAHLTLDALYPEAELFMSLGDPKGAAEWVDGTLRVLPEVSPDAVEWPVHAASLVRLMALRARIAAALGEPSQAAQWAAPVVALWSDADPFLHPLVNDMRRLMKPVH